MVPKEVGLEILAEYEAKQGVRSCIKKVDSLKPSCDLDPRGARDWIRTRLGVLGGSGLDESDQLTFLAGMFPQVPGEILSKACVPALEGMFGDYRELPWNRRRRRTMQRSKPKSVLLHVGRDKDGRKGFGLVLSVENSEKGLASRAVFQQLLRWAELGFFGGVVLGSWFKDGEDSEVDVVLRLRAMLLFAVAQAFSDLEESGPGNPKVDFPSEFSDPHQVALWAIQRTASHLSGSSSSGSAKEPIFFVCDKTNAEQRKTVWGDEAWGGFKQAYNCEEAVFDQACLGGSCAGSTSLVTSSWFLYEVLHAHRAGEEVKLFLQGLRDLRKIWGQQEPEGWTVGLRRTIQAAWLRWRDECAQAEEVESRKVLLAKLSEKEAYDRHVKQDHVPYMKGCPVCISAQGRQRPHWRSSFPDLHSISVDMAGPFIAGQSFNVEASGRDRGGGYRYMLAFAYAIPNKFEVDKSTDSLEEYEPSECGQLVPEPGDPSGNVGQSGDQEELFPELFSLPGNDDEGDFVIKAVTHRMRSKRPEADGADEEPLLSGEPTVPKARAGSHRTLFLGVPVRTKQGKEVLPQIQGVINKLEAAGFPVHRYHSDRAKELRSAALIAWLKGQGIHPSWTAGESPAGNRAELAVQGLKGFMRKLLAVSGLNKMYWPLALQHASTRNWINFNEAVGIPQPVLLPFGVKVHARRRTSTGYAAQWEPRTVAGTYVGHAPNTPGGHLVLIPDGDTYKVLLTNTIYPLRGSEETVVKPRYRLRDKRSPPFVVRVVAARELSTDFEQWARCPPGGSPLW